MNSAIFLLIILPHWISHANCGKVTIPKLIDPDDPSKLPPNSIWVEQMNIIMAERGMDNPYMTPGADFPPSTMPHFTDKQIWSSFYGNLPDRDVNNRPSTKNPPTRPPTARPRPSTYQQSPSTQNIPPYSSTQPPYKPSPSPAPTQGPYRPPPTRSTQSPSYQSPSAPTQQPSYRPSSNPIASQQTSYQSVPSTVRPYEPAPTVRQAYIPPSATKAPAYASSSTPDAQVTGGDTLADVYNAIGTQLFPYADPNYSLGPRDSYSSGSSYLPPPNNPSVSPISNGYQQHRSSTGPLTPRQSLPSVGYPKPPPAFPPQNDRSSLNLYESSSYLSPPTAPSPKYLPESQVDTVPNRGYSASSSLNQASVQSSSNSYSSPSFSSSPSQTNPSPSSYPSSSQSNPSPSSYPSSSQSNPSPSSYPSSSQSNPSPSSYPSSSQSNPSPSSYPSSSQSNPSPSSYPSSSQSNPSPSSYPSPSQSNPSPSSYPSSSQSNPSPSSYPSSSQSNPSPSSYPSPSQSNPSPSSYPSSSQSNPSPSSYPSSSQINPSPSSYPSPSRSNPSPSSYPSPSRSNPSPSSYPSPSRSNPSPSSYPSPSRSNPSPSNYPSPSRSNPSPSSYPSSSQSNPSPSNYPSPSRSNPSPSSYPSPSRSNPSPSSYPSPSRSNPSPSSYPSPSRSNPSPSSYPSPSRSNPSPSSYPSSSQSSPSPSSYPSPSISNPSSSSRTTIYQRPSFSVQHFNEQPRSSNPSSDDYSVGKVNSVVPASGYSRFDGFEPPRIVPTPGNNPVIQPQWSGWTAWTSCDESGRQFRVRGCETVGRFKCAGASHQDQTCTTPQAAQVIEAGGQDYDYTDPYYEDRQIAWEQLNGNKPSPYAIRRQANIPEPVVYLPQTLPPPPPRPVTQAPVTTTSSYWANWKPPTQRRIRRPILIAPTAVGYKLPRIPAIPQSLANRYG